ATTAAGRCGQRWRSMKPASLRPSRKAAEWRKCLRRRAVKEPNHWHLLRARRERPRGRCAAEQRDELAALHHSITSSARASRIGCTSRPSPCHALLAIDHAHTLLGTACISSVSAALKPRSPGAAPL